MPKKPHLRDTQIRKKPTPASQVQLFIFLAVVGLASCKTPCMFYFSEFDFIYDLRIFKKIDDSLKRKKEHFYLQQENLHVPGEYIINICQEIHSLPICDSPLHKEPFKDQGIFSR